MEVPEDLFQHDMSTFPTEDPAVTKQREAMEEKLRKAEEAAQRKQEQARKKERSVVEKLVATKPATSSAAPEEIAKRIALKKQKITLYFQHFAAKLSVKPPKALPDDEHKLDELLTTVRNELCSKGGIAQAGNIYLASVAIVERVNPLGLNLSGPAASLAVTAQKSREAWQDLVTEVAIDNAEWFMLGPVKRLVAVTVQMCMAVHEANTKGVAMQKPVPPEMQEQAKDL